MFAFFKFYYLKFLKFLRKPKHLILFALAVFFVLYSCFLKRFIVLNVVSKKTEDIQKISLLEVYDDVQGSTLFKRKIHGHDVEIELLKSYSVTAKVGYVDRYKNPVGKFYRAAYTDANKVYDDVVPQDLTLIWGKYAEEPYFSSIDFGHEYRMGVLYKINFNLKGEDWGNFHTIAGNRSIQKALDVLKYGDTVTIEGYLLYWKAFVEDENRMIDFRSAVYAGEKHKKHLFGGRVGVGLCKQIYVSKIVVNGHVFE